MLVYVKFDLESDDYYEMVTIPDDIHDRGSFYAVYKGSADVMDSFFGNSEYGYIKCHISIDPEEFYPNYGRFLVFPAEVEMMNDYCNIIDPGIKVIFRFKPDIDDQKNKEGTIMKYCIARYYRDKNGTLQDAAIDWAHREPIDIDYRIDRGVVVYNAIYRGYRDLRDELFDLCNNSVRAYISENSDMTNAVPCEIKLISYQKIGDSSDYEWTFDITLHQDINGYVQTAKPDLRIKRIIVRDPATIVFWEDGTKTVVKLSWADTEDGKFDIYAGVAYAIAKKLFGSNSAFKKEVNRKTEDKTPVYKFEPLPLKEHA